MPLNQQLQRGPAWIRGVQLNALDLLPRRPKPGQEIRSAWFPGDPFPGDPERLVSRRSGAPVLLEIQSTWFPGDPERLVSWRSGAPGFLEIRECLFSWRSGAPVLPEIQSAWSPGDLMERLDREAPPTTGGERKTLEWKAPGNGRGRGEDQTKVMPVKGPLYYQTPPGAWGAWGQLCHQMHLESRGARGHFFYQALPGRNY